MRRSITTTLLSLLVLGALAAPGLAAPVTVTDPVGDVAGFVALSPLATPTLLGTASAAPTATVAASPVTLKLSPASITKGQNTLAQVNARAGETVALYGRSSAEAPWKLLKAATTRSGYQGWVLTPGSTMDLVARPIGAPASRNSAIVTIRVTAPVPACSAKSIRKSHAESAHCIMTAYKRGDWAALSNYALPPVVAELRYWSTQGYNTRFSFDGCYEENYDRLSSSGYYCEVYWHPMPNDTEALHGTLVVFGMDLHNRAEFVETYG